MNNFRQEKTIFLDGRKVDFILVKNRLARHVHLRINPQTGLEVVVPLRFSADRLPGLVESKASWIIKKLAENRQQHLARPHLTDGSVIEILGIPKTINIISSKLRTPKVIEHSDRLTIRLNVNHLSAGAKTQEQLIKLVLENHCRTAIKNYLLSRTAQISAQMGTNYRHITIRAQKSRWGSCSRQNNLNFNWRLIFMPLPVIDYLVIHELAHTVHHNHGKGFHSLVQKHCPDYRELKKILRHKQVPF